MLHVPDLERKLDTLIGLAADDRDGPPPRLRHARDVGALGPVNIRELRARGGGRNRLLRILMTNACSYNCDYCPMRRDRELPRTLLKPEELVRIFLGALRRGWVDGLFVTTGIPSNPVRVMDQLIAALELLRERHGFAGYVHVKLVAGAEPAQIERLTALASRVSLNLEAPCGQSLTQIAPEKSLPVALENLERVRAIVLEERAARAHGRPADALHPGGVAGMTTQFVVGATPDTDRTLLETVARLQAGGGIHHAHFSAFRPIIDTPDGERGRRARAPGAPAVSGRLSAARLRLRRGRGGLRAVRQPAALGGSQGGLGAGASGAVSGGGDAGPLRGAGAGAGHRARVGPPARGRARRPDAARARRISAGSAWSPPGRRDSSRFAAGGCRRRGGPSSWASGRPRPRWGAIT